MNIPELERLQQAPASAERLTPSIISTKKESSLFSTMRQGVATNKLSKIRTGRSKTVKIDPITGTGTVRDGNFTLALSHYTDLTGLKTSTHQLLDALVIELTETGAKSPTVEISLTEYMERRGLKNRKEARRQIRNDIDVIRSIAIKLEDERIGTFDFINLMERAKLTSNGVLEFTLTPSFIEILLQYYPMPYPHQLLKLNNNANPNSYQLGRKIAEHKNMNIDKANKGDILSVRTLLESASFIPSYDDVMEGNRNLTDRIIHPFERDLDALSDIVTWEYCHSKGAPLTDEELKTFDYHLFITLLVKFTWRSYPDQTPRLKRKARAIKASRRKSLKAKKKTDTPS